MGATIYSGIIIGTKLSKIAKLETTTNTFEVHDKKGKPTGYFEDEEVYHLVINNEKKLIDDDIYPDDIAPNFNNEPSPDHLFCYCHNYNLSKIDLDNYVVGLLLTESSNEIESVNFTDVELYKIRAKELLKEKFNYEGEVSMILFSSYR